MNNTISTSLKKRTFADMIISVLICAGALIAAAWQFVAYLSKRDPIYLSNAVYSLVIFGELGLISLILLEIRKTGKPFSKKITAKLRFMALILIAGGAMPRFSEVSTEPLTYSVSVYFDMLNILVIFAGVIIGIISEIFVYGLSLQEDNDWLSEVKDQLQNIERG